MQHANAVTRLFQDANSFDDRITSLDDILRMEAGLDAATSQLRALLQADAGADGLVAHEFAQPATPLLHQALRVSYLDVERSAKIIRNLVRFRLDQGWPLTLCAAQSEPALRTRLHTILPRPDALGRAVLVFHASRLDPAVCPVKEFHRMASYVMEQLTMDPAVQYRGICVLLDLKDAGVAMARMFSITDIRRGIGMWKDCFPCKVKQIVIVGASALVSRLLGVGLALVHPRVRARVQVHRSIESLVAANQIDPSALPRELGGTWDEVALWSSWCDERLELERKGPAAIEAHRFQTVVEVPSAPPSRPRRWNVCCASGLISEIAGSSAK
jgi:hypothetical protein